MDTSGAHGNGTGQRDTSVRGAHEGCGGGGGWLRVKWRQRFQYFGRGNLSHQFGLATGAIIDGCHGSPWNAILMMENDCVGIFGGPKGESGGAVEHDQRFLEDICDMHRAGIDRDDECALGEGFDPFGD